MVILAGLIVIAGLVLLAERLNEIADENRSDKKIQEQALNGERDEADVYYGRGKLIRATLDVAADEYTGKYASPWGWFGNFAGGRASPPWIIGDRGPLKDIITFVQGINAAKKQIKEPYAKPPLPSPRRRQ
jgi:hypothetical protein